MNNNIGDEIQNVLRGKYGTTLIILTILILLWVFIRILPHLIEGSLVVIAAYLVLRWLSRKS